jgi:hypothetical protein
MSTDWPKHALKQSRKLTVRCPFEDACMGLASLSAVRLCLT